MAKLIIDIGSSSIRFLICDETSVLNKGKTYLNLANLIENHTNKKHIIKHILVIIDDIIKANFKYIISSKVIYGAEVLRQFEYINELSEQVNFKYNTDLIVLDADQQATYIYSIVHKYFSNFENINIIDITSSSLNIIQKDHCGIDYCNFKVGYNNLDQIAFVKYDINKILNQTTFRLNPTVLFGSSVEAFCHIDVVDQSNNLPVLNFNKLNNLLDNIDPLADINYQKKTVVYNSNCILNYLFNELIQNNVNLYVCREDLRFSFT